MGVPKSKPFGIETHFRFLLNTMIARTPTLDRSDDE